MDLLKTESDILSSINVFKSFFISIHTTIWQDYKNKTSSIISEKKNKMLLFPIRENDLGVNVLNAFIFIMILLHRWQSACG